ncbi:MAG: hypothetical protein RL545_213, partial [Actinomycetota bacterium]
MKTPPPRNQRNIRVSSSSARQRLLGRLNMDAQALTLAIIAVVAIFSLA